MSPRNVRLLLAAAVAGCLAWAAVEARHVAWRVPRGSACAGAADPAAVAESFRSVLAARQAGRDEEALLALRERAEKGPYPGYAWFLMGEAAYEARAYAAAVQSYRKAVQADPSVTDRGSALRASGTMRASLDVIQRSDWARSAPPELADLRYLQRRLLGGCE